MFVASTLIGFTVMERYPAMKVVVAHGKASWMQEVLEKMEASTRVIPLLHHYPVSTEPEETWEHGNVMLGFDAEERLIQKLPQEFAPRSYGARATRIRRDKRLGCAGPLAQRQCAGAADRPHDGRQRRPAIRRRAAARSDCVSFRAAADGPNSRYSSQSGSCALIAAIG